MSHVEKIAKNNKIAKDISNYCGARILEIVANLIQERDSLREQLNG